MKRRSTNLLATDETVLESGETTDAEVVRSGKDPTNLRDNQYKERIVTKEDNVR